MNVAVVGGGISGFVAGYTLLCNNRANIIFRKITIIEANNRVGGRALTTFSGIDLGGSWVWADSFVKTLELAKELNIPLMDHPGGSKNEKRFQGGIQILLSTLQNKSVNLAKLANVDFEVLEGAQVKQVDLIKSTDTKEDKSHCKMARSKVQLHVNYLQGGTSIIDSDYVLMAVPPRLAALNISWNPKIKKSMADVMVSQNIWMSSMGKIAFVYSEPWWQSVGTDFNIHRARPATVGPVVQIMDGSTFEDKDFVLVAFLAPDITGSGDSSTTEVLVQNATQQMLDLSKRLLGKVVKPKSTEHKIWLHDPLSFCSVPDAKNSDVYYSHPQPWINAATREFASAYDGCVILCSSETDDLIPGYIEGAIRSGKRGAESLLRFSEMEDLSFI
eukprot:CAMPEP_0196593596 /NCGR_PEP_ID=MMETSP1081-20130531/76041_1 /TAXON_ID=36882 /ORGANISM="Pyramimonas amylifera, Strain CCMP720" /LENGTH=387 /DNA_ID=CAMNT_0041917619 /DNA_START=77 /DNA_END=1240 /DNA_ORIENTATION=+